jgi:hypothetical protein
MLFLCNDHKVGNYSEFLPSQYIKIVVFLFYLRVEFALRVSTNLDFLIAFLDYSLLFYFVF